MSEHHHTGHPEGVHHELTDTDDRIWHLGVYLRCLQSWDFMNAAMRAATDDLADCVPTSENKLTLRYRGLELLRDVDNR